MRATQIVIVSGMVTSKFGADGPDLAARLRTLCPYRTSFRSYNPTRNRVAQIMPSHSQIHTGRRETRLRRPLDGEWKGTGVGRLVTSQRRRWRIMFVLILDALSGTQVYGPFEDHDSAMEWGVVSRKIVDCQGDDYEIVPVESPNADSA